MELVSGVSVDNSKKKRIVQVKFDGCHGRNSNQRSLDQANYNRIPKILCLSAILHF